MSSCCARSTRASHAAGDIASGGSGTCTVQIKCSGSFVTAPSITLSWTADGGSVSLRLLLPCTPLMLLEPRSISHTQYDYPFCIIVIMVIIITVFIIIITAIIIINIMSALSAAAIATAVCSCCKRYTSGWAQLKCEGRCRCVRMTCDV